MSRSAPVAVRAVVLKLVYFAKQSSKQGDMSAAFQASPLQDPPPRRPRRVGGFPAESVVRRVRPGHFTLILFVLSHRRHLVVASSPAEQRLDTAANLAAAQRHARRLRCARPQSGGPLLRA